MERKRFDVERRRFDVERRRFDRTGSDGSKTVGTPGALVRWIRGWMHRLYDSRGAGEAIDTSSDTEVLVGSIGCFGWDVLDRFEGMWAFAVFSEADGSLLLSRDRFGEKIVR